MLNEFRRFWLKLLLCFNFIWYLILILIFNCVDASSLNIICNYNRVWFELGWHAELLSSVLHFNVISFRRLWTISFIIFKLQKLWKNLIVLCIWSIDTAWMWKQSYRSLHTTRTILLKTQIYSVMAIKFIIYFDLITLFYFCRDLPSYLAVDLMAKNVLVVSSRIKLEELVACLGQKTEH